MQVKLSEVNSKQERREVVKRGDEWASSLHANKMHLKIVGGMKEIWSLYVSGRERRERELGIANWNSVPLLNLISQQKEEDEDKEEEEGEGGIERRG